MIDLKKIQEARSRIKPVVENNPLSFAPRLSNEVGTQIYLKKENLQVIGAFKIRGAFNKIASMSKEDRKNGVIASSAGNHAQGVAYSASYFSIPAVIVMPEATPLLKVLATKKYGAEVILAGDNYDEAYAYALKLAQEKKLHFIHPFADDEVMAGQGSIALEMIEEEPDVNIVFVPIGGGGLIGGIASAYKSLKPEVKIIGVTAKGAPAMRDSFKNKSIQKVDSVRTIADGIAVRDVNEKNYRYICEGVDDIVEVDDEEIASAVLYLLENQKLVVEGAGASGVAAVLHKKIELRPTDKVAIILSGGNIDVTMLNLIIEKGLIKSDRKMKFKVILVDKPGSLQKLTDILTQVGVNIVQIDYDRVSTSLDYGDASVTMALETKGRDHKEEIRLKLLEYGYKFNEIF
ncbi:threonine ammonia-lyase [Helicobacter cappadocius]|uniref:Threonine ammonia-lyase n=1 Tax=Helicobacter cappadocius TaxID=3063998 RepID=A0AA90PHB5_9HELI|nr:MULTISPECIES: threonine ammonia-lyase [unclassified Helicobacter]MDO7252440.1 threonine ammonia-lyase [Helicobacter sp. faydin-H75]MDP2538307.1 threonine ammonia-lyase [Helicobacter sp. faydin-H76]